MNLQLFSKKKTFAFERTYPAPITAVWDAWTRPEQLRQWWGPEKTSVPECEIDLRVGGRIYIVMEAGEEMGKYQGTRWPLEGEFTQVEAPTRLVYEARSWTEGEQNSFIEHVNEVELVEQGNQTVVSLDVTINEIGPGVKAKMAAFGMKWGYKAQLDKLEAHLTA
ncbi:MAG: SRPBCC domain-containing protein [Egicoccus sp.]